MIWPRKFSALLSAPETKLTLELVQPAVQIHEPFFKAVDDLAVVNKAVDVIEREFPGVGI